MRPRLPAVQGAEAGQDPPRRHGRTAAQVDWGRAAGLQVRLLPAWAGAGTCWAVGWWGVECKVWGVGRGACLGCWRARHGACSGGPSTRAGMPQGPIGRDPTLEGIRALLVCGAEGPRNVRCSLYLCCKPRTVPYRSPPSPCCIGLIPPGHRVSGLRSPPPLPLLSSALQVACRGVLVARAAPPPHVGPAGGGGQGAAGGAGAWRRRCRRRRRQAVRRQGVGGGGHVSAAAVESLGQTQARHAATTRTLWLLRLVVVVVVVAGCRRAAGPPPPQPPPLRDWPRPLPGAGWTRGSNRRTATHAKASPREVVCMCG